MRIVIPVQMVPKPRMTRSDKWRKRDCVCRYNAWKDEVRLHVNFRTLPQKPGVVNWVAFISMPKSWSKKKQDEMRGSPHQQRFDIDNGHKAILDCLWPDGDETIWSSYICKRWDDGKGARIELEVD